MLHKKRGFRVSTVQYVAPCHAYVLRVLYVLIASCSLHRSVFEKKSRHLMMPQTISAVIVFASEKSAAQSTHSGICRDEKIYTVK